MANRRMLSKSISYSKQVHSLSEFAKRLFTWTIPHLDDFGRIDGDPEVLKAMVVPMEEWTINEIEKAIQEMIRQELIERYQVSNKTIIVYTGFERHQTGLNKRTKSKYPDNPGNSGNVQEIQGNGDVTEPNSTDRNPTEEKLKKANRIEKSDVADKKSLSFKIINPKDFIPTSEGESVAFETWKRLEPNNPIALQTTYLKALKLKLPLSKFGEFASEIEQDSTIKNRGAVFQVKVVAYLKGKGVQK